MAAETNFELDSVATSVLDHLTDGVQIIDPEWRYRYVNDVVVAHGRTSRQALLGRTMMECYPGIDETALFSSLRECMETRSPIRTTKTSRSQMEVNNTSSFEWTHFPTVPS